LIEKRITCITASRGLQSEGPRISEISCRPTATFPAQRLFGKDQPSEPSAGNASRSQ
jgi:hypothetical protein